MQKELIELETRKDEELEEALRDERVKNGFWERSSTIYDEIELREKTQERIHEIKKIKKKKRNRIRRFIY